MAGSVGFWKGSGRKFSPAAHHPCGTSRRQGSARDVSEEAAGDGAEGGEKEDGDGEGQAEAGVREQPLVFRDPKASLALSGTRSQP